MGMDCKMCSSRVPDSPDRVVMCNHHNGPIHYGCCVDNCSLDGKPCEHALSIYEKI